MTVAVLGGRSVFSMAQGFNPNTQEGETDKDNLQGSVEWGVDGLIGFPGLILVVTGLQTELPKEKESFDLMKLSHDLAKLEAFKKQLVQSHSSENFVGWGVDVLIGVPHKDVVFKTRLMLLNERTLKCTFFGNYKSCTDLHPWWKCI